MGACGGRQVGAASDGDRIREPNGGPMLPEELRPAPSECVYSRLIIPKAGEVLRGATVGEDTEETQELPVDPARGGHGTWEEGVGSAIPVGVPVRYIAFAARSQAKPPHANRVAVNLSPSPSCILHL